MDRHGERDHWYDVLWSCEMDALTMMRDEMRETTRVPEDLNVWTLEAVSTFGGRSRTSLRGHRFVF
jgi:hypothetical protein